MLEYIFITFIVLICIQLFYYLFIFSSFSFSKKESSKNSKNNLPISVLVCAKNEAENLTKNIPFYLQQKYPNFELVFINDRSTDDTLEILKKFKKENPTKITIVDVKPNEQFWGSKKYALTLGIKAATNEHLLFTDADCKPVSKHWITTMARNFNQEKIIILGYGAYEKIKGSFLNKLIRFETILTAIQYFSYAKLGIPYMGVGRNLAYTKSLFFNASGFSSHMNIKSGDDDLFINQVATKENTISCCSDEGFTESISKRTFKEWIQQKRRHVGTASHYKGLHQFLLGLFYSSQLLYLIFGIVLLSFLFQWKIVLLFLILRMIVQFIVVGAAAKKLQENDLILLAPFFEIFLVFTQMFIFIKNLITKPTHW